MDIFFPKRALLQLLSLLLTTALTVGCDVGLSAEDHFNKGMELQQQGDLETAVIHFKNALQKQPENIDARLALAQTYLDLGDGLGAEKELKFAQKSGAANTNLDLAQALLLQNKFAQAQTVLENTRDQQNTPRWLNSYGEAALGLKDISKAETSFLSCLEIDQSNIDAMQGLANVALVKNDLATAETHLEAALHENQEDSQTWFLKGKAAAARGDADNAAKYYSRSLELKKGVATRVALIRLLLGQNKPDDAKEHIDALKKDFPDNVISNYLEAVYAYQKEDLSKAKGIFQKVISVKADHVPSLFLLGKIHYQSKEYEQAQYVLSKLVSVAPEYLEARKLLAICQINLKLPKDAIHTLKPVAQQAASDFQLSLLLANAYFADGQSSQGEEYLKKAADIAPDPTALRTQLAAISASRDIDKGIEELKSVIESGSDSHRAELMLGILYLKKNQFDKALEVAQQLIDKQGADPLYYNLAAGAYEGKKSLDQARSFYEKTLSMDPGNATANVNLARLDLLAKDEASARKHFEAVLSADRNNEQALMGLAVIVGGEGNNEEAIKLLNRARTNNPSAFKPRLLLTEIYLRLKNHKEAIETAQEAVDIAPEFPQAVMMLGQAQLAAGDTDAGVRSLKKLAKLTPKSAETFFMLAKAQITNKDYDGAKTSLRKVLDLDNKKLVLPAKMALGSLELALGNHEQATSLAQEISREFPENPEGNMLQGDIYMSQKKAADAVKAYKAALARSPNSYTTNKLSAAYNATGESGKGLEVLRNWLKKNPKDLYSRINLAQLLQQEGRQSDAISEYEHILELQPDNLIALNNLSGLYLKTNDPRYLEFAEKAHKLAPDVPHIKDTYGWALVKSGSLEQGLNLIENAASAVPSNYDIRYHLSAALVELGNVERARKELEEIVSGNKQFSEREAAAALLKKIGK